MKKKFLNYITKRYVFSMAMVFFSICGFSQSSIASWNLTGVNVAASSPVTTNDANLSVSALSKNTGMGNSNSSFPNSIHGTGVSATSLAEAITNNEYIEFTISPASGKSVTITSIDVSAMSQGQTATCTLLSSVGGFVAGSPVSSIALASGNQTGISNQTLTVGGHANLTSPVTFRFYFHGATNLNYFAFGIGERHTGTTTADLIVKGSVNTSDPDLNPPTVPGALTANSVEATSLRLNWTASTDDHGVTGYDVYNGQTLLGSTTTALTYNVNGLTAETSYTFRVIAKDASGKQSAAATVSVATAAGRTVGDVPKLPIGMNIPGLSYYSTSLVFTDAMKMSGAFMSFYDGVWSSETMSEIPRDANGYPTQVPFRTSDGKDTKVRQMLNSYYSGRHVLTFDGVGTINIGGVTNQKISSNKYYIDFNGSGSNAWVDILTSTNGNHLKNFKILPLEYENSSSYPTFNPKFLDGLRPFHAFRFMDWIGTNNSKQKFWSDRSTKTYYSQAADRDACYDYAIELCNELDVDAWVTIPHQADDNFIQQAARLWRDGLRANRKVYIEYSNEIWNWQFTQAGYCVNNAPGHPNPYVSQALAAISAEGNHPEKDAYMIARTNRLWKAEFTGVNANRLVRVAGVQHGWMDNTRRILNYLFDVDKAGVDVVSPGGYFNFSEAQHNSWLARCGTDNAVTPAEICDGVSSIYNANEGSWTDKTAEYANARGVGYVVYEGGQHMQPYMQGDHCYNQAVWDAQIHPKMYDLYMQNFRKMIEPQVDCSLFMAFAYMSQRESKYGSWGHLENLAQIGNPDGYMTIAPKYQALLDANIPKGSPNDVPQNKINSNEMMVFPNPASGMLNVDFGLSLEHADISILDLQGRTVMSKTATNKKLEILNVANLNSGIYFVRVVSNGKMTNSRFVKK